MPNIPPSPSSKPSGGEPSEGSPKPSENEMNQQQFSLPNQPMKKPKLPEKRPPTPMQSTPRSDTPRETARPKESSSQKDSSRSDETQKRDRTEGQGDNQKVSEKQEGASGKKDEIETAKTGGVGAAGAKAVEATAAMKQIAAVIIQNVQSMGVDPTGKVSLLIKSDSMSLPGVFKGASIEIENGKLTFGQMTAQDAQMAKDMMQQNQSQLQHFANKMAQNGITGTISFGNNVTLELPKPTTETASFEREGGGQQGGQQQRGGGDGGPNEGQDK
ncbi:MAG: hypothetical protein S4CHLAM45_11760 [Chlamydiales bacterium]|nr:hypothetical protein [Chlamydiales bacterium]MCH9619668.1 hypothetical protein [Chlamydiales bacterium]MCH9623274.1 hypothetical protein [Chlamydiales bacterium]